MRRNVLLALLASVVTAACGSDSSTGPSNAVPATLQGTVNGGGASAAVFTTAAAGAPAKASIKVTVVGTGLSTTTDASGRFVLTGITSGSVVLRFEGPGIDATLEITGLVAGQTLTIKVKVSGHQASIEDDGDDDDDGSSTTKCFTAGQKAEVEGRIASTGGSDITVSQQGKGDYLCRVSASTRIRHGNKTFAFADLKVGDHVHVSGRGAASSGGKCTVDAEEIKLQN
jgi:hypothetical protein